MKTDLEISTTLALPLALAAHTVAVLAQKGWGKTYAAMRITEALLEQKQQVVALDPTGVWWGLRAASDDRKNFSFPIIVAGGEHADIPLEPTAGAILARFAVESRKSIVLDMSGFESGAAQDRFATDFAVALYRLKATHRETIHLMVDEADSFAPQRPLPGQQTMLGAFEAIVRRGRSRGIGITMISQRPAVLNKNVLSQADLLIAGRVVGMNDHAALSDWAALYGTKEQLTEFGTSLPKLETGEAWFWSPSWLGIFGRHRISKRLTFDSSRTPTPGEERTAPALRKVDLASLSAEISESMARAKASDPGTLKRRVAELEAEIKKLDHAAKKSVPKGLTTTAKNQLITRLTAVEKSIFDATLHFIGIKRDFEPMLGRFGKLHESAEPTKAARVDRVVQQLAPARASAPVPARRPVHSAAATNGDTPSGGLRRMMIALAQRPGLNGRQLGVRAGMSSKSGTFGTYLGRMRSNGWMEGSRDSMNLTGVGESALGQYDPLPTGTALLEYWIAELGQSGAARMLRALANSGRAMTKHELGEAAEISSTSGTFGTYLGRLRALELVDGKSELVLSPELQ